MLQWLGSPRASDRGRRGDGWNDRLTPSPHLIMTLGRLGTIGIPLGPIGIPLGTIGIPLGTIGIQLGTIGTLGTHGITGIRLGTHGIAGIRLGMIGVRPIMVYLRL